MTWLAIGLAGGGAVLGGTGVLGGKGGFGGALNGAVLGGGLGYGAGALGAGGAANAAGAGNFNLGAWDLGEGVGGTGAAFGAAGKGAGNLGTLHSIMGLLGGGQGGQGGGQPQHAMIHSQPVPAPIANNAPQQPLGVDTNSGFEQWAQQTYGPNWRGSHNEAEIKAAYERLHGGQGGGSQYATNPLQTHAASIAPNIYG